MSQIASSIARRLKGDLPPSPPHPAVVQTFAGRWSPYAYVEHCQAVCGDCFTLYPLDMPPIVFFADPDDIRTILTGGAAELHPGAAGSIVAPIVGEHSFMLLEEDDHLWGRRAITPAFHQQMVREQTAIVTDVVERFVASWPLRVPIALYPHICALTLTVILRIIFSDGGTELPPLREQLMRMLKVTDSFLLQVPKLRHFPNWRTTWRTFVAQRAEVDELIHRLVRRRCSDRTGHRGDLLDMLLAAENSDGSPMSEQQIRDNLMSVILAGYETTTGQLVWAFQLLAHNPKVQHRLIEELDDSTGGDDYLTATVHETLRRKPVFLFTIPREVVKPVQIGGRTYRPPVRLAACTYLMHHNPELYPQPHSFRPERFLGATPQPRTWLPWGGGRRHCLGRHFAMLEVGTVLRRVLVDRTVEPASRHVERPRWRSAILVPSAGGRVILNARTG